MVERADEKEVMKIRNRGTRQVSVRGSVHARMKAEAEARGISMSKLVDDAVAAWEHEQGSTVDQGGR